MSEETMNEKPELLSQADFTHLVSQANAGDADALKKLRELLDGHPEVWQRIGDLAAHAELVMVNLIAADNKLMAESLKRKLREMKTDLIGPATSMLEKMAVGRVLACWLQVEYIDNLVVKSTGGTLSNSTYQLKRQDAAHKRYTAAVKSLTDIRRLLPKASNERREQPLRVFDEDQPAHAATA